jgi:hypothetical protein
MARVTNATLTRAVELLEKEMRDAGLLTDDENLILSYGSKTYGRAFRLYVMRKGSSAHHSDPIGLGDGFLGMTSEQAHRTMATMWRTLQAVSFANEKRKRVTA